jgi:hypothetical protein
MKKITYVIFSILIFLGLSSFGQNRDSEFNQPKKKTFEKNSFGNNTGPERAGPPDPGGGGTGGNPIPISGGFILLSGGLLIYSLTRKQQNKKDA